MVAATMYLREGRPRTAVRALRQGVEAYRGFQKLARKVRAKELPPELADFRGLCVKALGALELGVRPGKDPVRTLVETVRRLPSRRRAPPGRVIDALDAVVTAGRSVSDPAVEQRLVRQVARMLGGRVLFHYANGQYLTLRPQEKHTLSTWTIRTILRDRRITLRRVRPRPEFWRPEQQRPRGLLSFPVPGGVACIERGSRFKRREAKAVRAILRFWRALAEGRPMPAAPSPSTPATEMLPPLAGEGLIGQSVAWRRVLRTVLGTAETSSAVLLFGETGTGKERLARAIHATSRRAIGPFVAINCGALSRDLLASELFGHVRGAFTGADRSRDGAFVQAHRGTLFLDEVGDMPPDMQVAILRVIEDRKVRPVGSERDQLVDIRIVSATNKDLHEEVEAGRFRADLLHRINSVEVHLPPLRERDRDILLLADHLLGRMAEPRRIHIDAVPVLLGYAWPGNVRELDNVLRAAALLEDGPEITPEILRRILENRRRGAADPEGTGGHRRGGILEALRTQWRSATDLAGLLGISTRTVNRDLAQLVREGAVETFGEARSRRYRAVCRDLSRLGKPRPERP